MKENDNLLMKILRDMDISLSRAAVMIMLEDGMLTEERPFIEYICAKNINEALNSPDITPELILSRGLDKETSRRLIMAYHRNK